MQETVRSDVEVGIGRELVWKLLLLLFPLLLTFLLYWPTLSQPYFWDDIVHYDFLTTRTLLRIWTDVTGMSYYRPLAFTLYKTCFETLPPGETTLPHFLLLLVHAVNAWLVGNLLARLLSRNPAEGRLGPWGLGLNTGQAAGLMAALLFVAYPFAALPVSHFAAIVHPLVTLFTLGTTLSTLLFTSTGRSRWMWAAIGLALLAPFVHESGVLTGTVAVTVQALDDWPKAKRRWQLLLLLPLASTAFLLAWLLVPKTPTTFEWVGWGGILASVLFFTQGPTFVLQPASRFIMDRVAAAAPSITPTVAGLPVQDMAVISLIGLLALTLAGLALWRARQLRILCISVLWAFLVALPSIIVLPFPYVSVSQRLLYAGGPPAAMLWATVCVSLAARARTPAGRVAITAGLTVAIAAVPVLYVRREMRLHELALKPVEQLAAIGRQHPTDKHMVVNAVNWINYKQPWYALGQEGVSVSADYVDFERLIQVNSGTEAEFAAATWPAIKARLTEHYYSTVDEETPWDGPKLAVTAHEYDQVWVTLYNDNAIETVLGGRVERGATIAPPLYVASFDRKAYLLEATLEVQARVAIAQLQWKFIADLHDVTVFRHVLDCNGNLIGQADGDTLAGLVSFAGLEPGTEVYDIRFIPLEPISGDGCHILSVGLYSADGSRVQALDPDGEVYPDRAVPVASPPRDAP